MPMLTLCNARLGDIDAELSAFLGFQKFGETPPVITVHLQRKRNLILREI